MTAVSASSTVVSTAALLTAMAVGGLVRCTTRPEAMALLAHSDAAVELSK